MRTPQPEASTGDTALRAEEKQETDVLTIRELSFTEQDNRDCSDKQYGCTCISYEKCCGCIIQ
ncbi:MAG: hypothetical protein PHU43_04465 [Candidatus Bipolaricaulis sp.]|nr:hypothetical protein [Candidatus Bipolaricaulis sp.]